MSSPARKLEVPSAKMDLQKLEAELLCLPFVVRQHLAHSLLDSLGEDQVELEAHRRALQMERGEVDEIDADEVIAALRDRRPAPGVEAAWAAEAHRRWEAYQRGEEEMLDFDGVMAEIRASFRR
jgi:hypothetical protein